MHGFRDSHSVAVPHSIDSYYRNMPKKRRYNLLRQERLLENHLGSPLSLRLVEQPADLPDFFRSLTNLGVPREHRSLLRGMTNTYLPLIVRFFDATFSLAGTHVIGMAVGAKSNDTWMIDRFFYDKVTGKALAWHRSLAGDSQISDSRIDI